MNVRLKLIKWTLLLCAGLFCSMLVLGQDQGQERLGLKSARTTLATRNVVAPVEVAPAQPMAETNVSLTFAPTEPLIAAPEPEKAPGVEQAASASGPEPVLMYVSAKRARLRAGPGKDYTTVAKLTHGQAVELVPTDLGLGDWILVRADGARGYISATVLTENVP